MRLLQKLTSDDRRVAKRILLTCVAIAAVAATLLAAPRILVASGSGLGGGMLIMQAVFQSTSLALPIGVALSLVWVGREVWASTRSRRLALAVGLAVSATSFVMLAWAIPSANQAFRAALAQRLPMENVSGPTKGVSELTLVELGRLTGEDAAGLRPETAYRLGLEYHTRLALAFAPLVVAAFVVAMIRAGNRGRLALSMGCCLAVVSYFGMTYLVRVGYDRSLPPFAVAWMTNVVFLVVSAATVYFASLRNRADVDGSG